MGVKMKNYATEEDFKKAPLGYPFLECCPSCGHETGNVMIKSMGTNNPEAVASHSIPKYLVSPENQCEFCHALSFFLSSEKINPKVTGEKYGAAKTVFVGPDSEQTLHAYVPFSGSEQKEPATLTDGTKFTLRHRMIIEVKHFTDEDGKEGAGMAKILDEGVR